MSKNSIFVTDSMFWICPTNVNFALIIAAGGGGGGGSGSSNWGGGGSGGGSTQQVSYLQLIPGMQYTLQIGAGGNGGFYDGINQNTANGQDGQSTDIFETISGSLVFSCLGGGGAGVNTSYPSFGGASFANANGETLSLTVPTYGYALPGAGAVGSGTPGTPGMNANYNSIGGYVPGASPTDSGSSGAGGGAGPKGSGGDGGLGSINQNGTSALPNSGAGGGGGGTDTTTIICGQGGNGGSGYLYLIW